jgi:hypothetical protein
MNTSRHSLLTLDPRAKLRASRYGATNRREFAVFDPELRPSTAETASAYVGRDMVLDVHEILVGKLVRVVYHTISVEEEWEVASKLVARKEM